MGIVSDPSSRGKGFVTARPGGTSGERGWGEGKRGCGKRITKDAWSYPGRQSSIRGPAISKARNAPTPLGPLAFFWLRGGCVLCYRMSSMATRTRVISSPVRRCGGLLDYCGRPGFNTASTGSRTNRGRADTRPKG